MSYKLKLASIYVPVGLFVIGTTLTLMRLQKPNEDWLITVAGLLMLGFPIDVLVFFVLAATAEYFLEDWINKDRWPPKV